jgi:hypothetical protein
MKRPVNLGTASLKALGIVVTLGAAAHASLPYLPQIGPPPLRVQTVRSPASPVVQFLAFATAATNATAAAHQGTGPAAIFTGPVNLAGTPENAGTGAFPMPMYALPTPDLVGITPQMLAAYFRPIQIGTNGLPMDSEYRVDFMPPLPPDHSSHAEYKVK